MLMRKLILTCREAAVLMLMQQDRRLSWRERFGLRVHLFVCRACPRFARQLDLMRSAMGRWRTYSERIEDGD